MENVPIKIYVSLAIVLLIGGCADKTKVLSIQGACEAFEAPPYVVRGQTRYDQRWIDGNIEAGVGACQWPRPQARPAGIDARTGKVTAPAPKKPSLGKRIKARVGKIWERPSAPPPPVVVEPPQPAPVVLAPPKRSDLDELLDPSARDK